MIIPMARLREEYGVAPRSVLHVGAHLGEEAPAYHDAGITHVMWVEANPELFGELEARVGYFPGQWAVSAAVTDKDGEVVTLRLCTFSMASSILEPKEHLVTYPGMHYLRSVDVETVTVDTLVGRYFQTSPFDMLNIDIEGAELLAFKGAERTLAGLKWIYLEVNHREMYAGCAMDWQVDDYLRDRGFERVAMADEGWDHGFSDALYQRRADA